MIVDQETQEETLIIRDHCDHVESFTYRGYMREMGKI